MATSNERENWEKRRIEIEEFTKENNFINFFEASAKDGTNLAESIMSLVNHIITNNIESESSRDAPGVDLTKSAESNGNNASGSCC